MTTHGTEAEILALAQQADDAKDRAYLLLLLKINNSLEANTEATQEIAKEIQGHVADFASHRIDFQKHVQEEAALFNQGRGAWKVTAVVLSVAQIAAFAVASWYISKQNDEAIQLKAMSEAIIRNESRHNEFFNTEKLMQERIEKLERKAFGQ